MILDFVSEKGVLHLVDLETNERTTLAPGDNTSAYSSEIQAAAIAAWNPECLAEWAVITAPRFA